MNSRVGTRALALVLSLALIFGSFAGCGKAETKTDSKTISVTVVHKDGSSKDLTIETDSENLRGALEQENLVQGEESEYGLYVKTVDGETVDDANEEWWCFTKGGESLPTGVDSTKIEQGDAYEITFTVGW